MAASNVYSLEPTTRGAVMLRTSAGDVLIELFARECPLAVRNFCQLCVDGAYDGAPFYRVVPNTLIQAGNEGKDLSSFENGEPFRDEFHSRLEFRGRGFVAMANESKPNSNRAHFFITLKPCPWLNRKHTIFGIIRGDPVYVAVKIGESPVDGERALFPVTIKGATIVEQPFQDSPPIVPCVLSDKKDMAAPAKRVATDEKSAKKLKPASALSFLGESDDEDEAVTIKKPNPSVRNAKARKPLVSAKEVTSEESSSNEDSSESSSDEETPANETAPDRDNTLAAKLKAFAAKRTAS